jgi:molecular chaperone DnaJ
MNYYQILKVKPSASTLEIKQAYRRLAKQFHPDSQTSTANHEEIIRLNQAYEVLRDSQSRYIYDQKIKNNSVNKRQQKNYSACSYYQRQKQENKAVEYNEFYWLKDVYSPLNSLINKILNPLENEIYQLSADPFDDDLMLTFTNYLDNCHSYFQEAKNILISQPNPSKYAGVALNLYYCLNHISDGIDELERFTQNYDDYYLHTGKELFNLAIKINQEAITIANKLA